MSSAAVEMPTPETCTHQWHVLDGAAGGPKKIRHRCADCEALGWADRGSPAEISVYKCQHRIGRVHSVPCTKTATCEVRPGGSRFCAEHERGMT